MGVRLISFGVNRLILDKERANQECVSVEGKDGELDYASRDAADECELFGNLVCLLCLSDKLAKLTLFASETSNDFNRS